MVTLALSMVGLCAEEERPGLQSQLDEFRARFEEKASPAKVEAYEEGVESVRQSGVVAQAINVGDQAPRFSLTNAEGDEVSLESLLDKGPVVVTWYRGGWCPYCNLTLAALQEALPDIHAAGAQLVALTPELPDKSLSTAEKSALTFEVLTDLNNKVAREYGIVFQLTEFVENAMRQFANLKSWNGDDYAEDELPLSATYIIDSDGVVRWAFLDAEYRNRAEPSVIVEQLRAL